MGRGIIAFLAAATIALSLAGSASATLYVRGQGAITSSGSIGYGNAGGTGFSYKLIYDSEQDITWLDFSQKYNTWQNQSAWAANLVVEFGGEVLDQWRLPITDESKANLSGGFGYAGPDATGYHNYSYGYNMVHTEMGHLYYLSLGNLGYYALDGSYPQAGWGLASTGPFNEIYGQYYWSATEKSTNTSIAWNFRYDYGTQNDYFKTNNMYGMAVMEGDVGTVPVPAAVWLLGSGLAGLFGLRAKTKRN